MSQELLATHVNKRWLTKQLVILAIFIGFGGWALYDALMAYPARGANAAAYFEMQYFERLSQDGRPMSGVEDPQGQLARLREVEPQNLGATEQALFRWLDALALIHKATPEHTRFPRTDFRTGASFVDARTRLEELKSDRVVQSPKPLSAFDIPSQWVILGACWGIGGWILLLMLRVCSKKFRYDPAEHRLTLANGESLTPADLGDVNKQLWHRFYVTLEIKDAHPTLGGQSLKLDLLRYVPLEDWVLEMERIAFPDRASDEAKHDAASESGAA